MHRVMFEDMENIFSRENNWEKFEGQTVLITGAYGMLASYIVYFFMYLRREKAIDVCVLAQGRNKEKAKEKFNEYWNTDGFQFVDFSIVESVFIEQKVNYIIHAASLASPQYYSTNPVEVALPNAVGTYYLLKLAVQKRVKGFLLFSSGDIYGKVDEPGEIDEGTLGKMDPLNIHSCYGESKRMAETWCNSFWREYGVPVVIARIAHTYGPTMDVKNDPRVFASFLNCVLNGQDINMYSDGTTKRPFCYIADATEAFLLLLLKGERGQAYNVVNDDMFISIKELGNMLVLLRPELQLKVVCKKRSVLEDYVENKANKDNLPVATKLKKLGWRCDYSLQQGFERTFACLYENTLP